MVACFICQLVGHENNKADNRGDTKYHGDLNTDEQVFSLWSFHQAKSFLTHIDDLHNTIPEHEALLAVTLSRCAVLKKSLPT